MLLLWFVALLVLIGVVYTFAWMRLADVVRSRVEGTLTALRAMGATADCANHEVRGFPLHFIPTYPGDEEMMQSALFRLLRPALPSEEKKLGDIIAP